LAIIVKKELFTISHYFVATFPLLTEKKESLENHQFVYKSITLSLLYDKTVIRKISSAR
jgi:hypothetical protein